MSAPLKPPKPTLAKSYLQLPKEEKNPLLFTTSQQPSVNNSYPVIKEIGNPFDNMDDVELNLIVIRSKNPFNDDFPNDRKNSFDKQSHKRPILNSFDDVNIVSKPKKKAITTGKKKRDVPTSDKSMDSQQEESDKSRTRESRSKFMKKIQRMEHKVVKNSYDQHTVMAIDNDDDNGVIRFLLSDRGGIVKCHSTF
jgi:hypothetical protein